MVGVQMLYENKRHTGLIRQIFQQFRKCFQAASRGANANDRNFFIITRVRALYPFFGATLICRSFHHHSSKYLPVVKLIQRRIVEWLVYFGAIESSFTDFWYQTGP